MGSEMDSAIGNRSSPATKARVAGAFYVLSFLSATLAEALIHGKMMRVAGLVPILCFTVVTLILFQIFLPVGRVLSLVAALLNFVSLLFEALEFHPHGLNAALISHGGFCLLIALLILRSKFLPHVLSAPMAIAGLVWLSSLSPQVAHRLHAYVQAAGFAGEGVFMLWLLAKGVNNAKWNEAMLCEATPLERRRRLET